MNSETLCDKHQKPLTVVCVDQQCEAHGLLCCECINQHIHHTLISLEKYEREVNTMVLS